MLTRSCGIRPFAAFIHICVPIPVTAALSRCSDIANLSAHLHRLPTPPAYLRRMRLSPGQGAAAGWQMMLPAESGTLPHRPWTTMSLVNGSPQAKRCGGMERSGSLCGRGCRAAEADVAPSGRACRSAGNDAASAEALEPTEHELAHKKEDDHCGHPHTEKIN